MRCPHIVVDTALFFVLHAPLQQTVFYLLITFLCISKQTPLIYINLIFFHTKNLYISLRERAQLCIFASCSRECNVFSLG